MRTALYYPHTRIKSEGLLKTALLLWDNLEYIVPHHGYGAQYPNKGMEEAIELIGKPRLPSDENKRELHELVEDFATQQPPQQFYYRGDETDPQFYEVYPQKLLPDTWRALQETGLASRHATHDRLGRQPLPQVTGLWLMSLLADCCAGATRARIADRGDAYASIHSLLAQEPLGQHEGSYDFIVPLTLKLINTSHLPLTKLIKFREREEKEANGYQLRGLRHRYLELIETHINDLRSKKKPADREEAQRCFESDA